MRQAIVGLGDKIAEGMGIYDSKEYQEKRYRFLEDDNKPKTPLDRLEEYDLYLRLLARSLKAKM